MNITVHRFASVSSTNDVALRMAESGAPEGTVVIADEQTSGRGRLGRGWTSPPGEGLYLTIIFRPLIALDHVWQIAFVSAVAGAKALQHISGLKSGIKWPNDLLLNGRKAGGILIEARADADYPVVVVGIGINVGNSSFPPEIAETATSIKVESGLEVSVEQTEKALQEAVDQSYTEYVQHGFDQILAEWREYDCTSGRQVSVVKNNSPVVGTAEGVDDQGNLLVRTPLGLVSVSAGDVVVRRE